MYRVVSYFTDNEDGDHPYNVGDSYPRNGLEVSAERIAHLASNKTKRGFPVIEKVPEKKKPVRKAQKEE